MGHCGVRSLWSDFNFIPITFRSLNYSLKVERMQSYTLNLHCDNNKSDSAHSIFAKLIFVS